MESSRISLLWALTCGLTRENGRTDPCSNEICKHQPLKRKYSQLVSNITCTGDIVAQLFQDRMLTEKERDVLQSLHATPIRANEELLIVLMAKPPTVYERFLTAIRNTNQNHVYRMLISETEFGSPESPHRSLIQRHYSWLIEMLDLANGLPSLLYQYGVLTERERERIDASTEPFRKSEVLLSIVGMKSPDIFKLFLTALKDTNQHHIADRLGPNQGPMQCKPPTAPKLFRNIRRLTSSDKQNVALGVKRNYSKLKAISIRMQNRVLTDVWVKTVFISQTKPEVSCEIVKACLLEILKDSNNLQNEIMKRKAGAKHLGKDVRSSDPGLVTDTRKLETEIAILKEELAKQKKLKFQQQEKNTYLPSDLGKDWSRLPSDLGKDTTSCSASATRLLRQTNRQQGDCTVTNNLGNLSASLPKTAKEEISPSVEDKLRERDNELQEMKTALEKAKMKLGSVKALYEELLRSVKPKRLDSGEIRSTLPRTSDHTLTAVSEDAIVLDETCEMSSKELHALKNNRAFLVEILDCSLLVELLQSRKCISDEEANRINGQSNVNFKRDEFLNWLSSVKRKQFKTVVDIIRLTGQPVVATVLENGGVVVKSSVSFEKQFAKKRELVEQLNAISYDSTSHVDKQLQELKALKIEIAPCCCVEEKSIVVWFWCRSQSALRRLQDMYMSKNLKRRLNKLCRNVLRNGDGSPHQRTPDPIVYVHIYAEEFRKIFRNIDYERDPSYIQMISTRAAGRDNRPVTGVAILHEELFVLSALGCEVEVFDRMTLVAKDRRGITGLKIPGDIASSPANNTLYILDWRTDEQSSEVVAIEATGRVTNRWLTGSNCWCGGMSVSREANVVVAVFLKNKIQEYNPIGQLVRELVLPELVHPWHAVKLDCDRFVVSHGCGDDRLQRVCMMDANGATLGSYGDGRAQVLSDPMYLTVDSDGSILVADYGNRRLIMLGPKLEFKRQIFAGSYRLQRPRKVVPDESNCRLFVADDCWKDGRILVFDIN